MKGCWTYEGVHFHLSVLLLLAWFDSIQLKLDRPLKGSQTGFTSGNYMQQMWLMYPDTTTRCDSKGTVCSRWHSVIWPFFQAIIVHGPSKRVFLNSKALFKVYLLYSDATHAHLCSLCLCKYMNLYHTKCFFKYSFSKKFLVSEFFCASFFVAALLAPGRHWSLVFLRGTKCQRLRWPEECYVHATT